MNTYKQLEEAPDSSSPEFIEYLRSNNAVVFEDDFWLLIENCKYHSLDYPHYTGFVKVNATDMSEINESEAMAMRHIAAKYDEWIFIVNKKLDRTIDRFHFHLLTDLNHYNEERLKWETGDNNQVSGKDTLGKSVIQSEQIWPEVLESRGTDIQERRIVTKSWTDWLATIGYGVVLPAQAIWKLVQQKWQDKNKKG